MTEMIPSRLQGKFISARKLFIFGQNRNLFLSAIARAQYETIGQIRSRLMKLLGQDAIYSTDSKPRSYLLKYLPKSQEELPVRSMKDSFDHAIVPLSTDSYLRDRYTSNLGQVRLGRLMEDMDMFAGHIGYKHALYPNVPEGTPCPIVIVTIAVSQIEFLQQVKSAVDIQLSGHVCWVGNSSVEIVVWLQQEVDGKMIQITRALFLMAARNSINTGPAILNAIKAETKEEEDLLKGGEERKIRRQKLMSESLLTTVPTEEELHIVHSLFIRTIDRKGMFLDNRILPPKSKWMQDATLSTLVFCHPEYRNQHNKVFGGFLMRQALELSWIIGFLHGMKIPKLIRISDIGFYTPVEVGSIVKMFGSVTYTEGQQIQILVSAEAYSSVKSQGTSSTVFNFTYDLGKPIDQVFPTTYLEAMKYLDGRRHYKEVINLGDASPSVS